MFVFLTRDPNKDDDDPRSHFVESKCCCTCLHVSREGLESTLCTLYMYEYLVNGMDN